MNARTGTLPEEAPDGRAPYVLLGGLACLYVATAIWSPGLGYGGDSFTHYLISRYSWKHPELFLHNWGKPFFILLSSPFTQLGWPGMIAFNVSCAIATAYVTYRSCRTLRMPWSTMSIVLVALMPVYFGQIPTGLTEPLFTLVVALSAYLFLRGRLVWACLLISFLPLVRTEGVVVLPLFLVALVVRGCVAKAPVLATGLVLYSLVGYVVKGNLWWLMTEGYRYQSPIYGRKGTLLHYFRLSPHMYGLPLLPLIILGLGWLVVTLLTRRDREQDHENLVIAGLLMTGSFAMLFGTYVGLWWRGLFDVIGETRYIAATAPGATVTAMFGLRWVLDRIGSRRAPEVLTIVALCLLAALSAYRLGGIGRGLSGEQALTRDAARWLSKSGHATQKIYYVNPIVPFELNADPYDNDKMDTFWALRRESPPKGAIIFWDAHFGPREARLPLANLQRGRDLLPLKAFVPEVPFPTFNEYPFEIHIFQKKSDVDIAVYASE